MCLDNLQQSINISLCWFAQILVPKHLEYTGCKVFHTLHSRASSNLQVLVHTICRCPIGEHTHRCGALGERRQPTPTSTIVPQLEALKSTIESVNNAEEQVFPYPKSTAKVGFIVDGIICKVVSVEAIVCSFSIPPNDFFLLSWS